MRIYRRWQIALPLLLGAVLAVPANAQQPPEPADTVAPAPAKPAPAKKPAKPKTTPAKPAEAAREARRSGARETAKPAEAAPAKPATPPNIGGVKPTLLGQYGEWGAYTASPGGKKVCFAIAKPTSSQTTPPNRPRNPVYMFISSRPAEKVSNEVSIIIGYPFKPGTEAIGGRRLDLVSRSTPSRTAPGSRTRPKKRRWSTPCAPGQSAVVKGVSGQRHAIVRHVLAQGPRAGPRPRRPGMQVDGREPSPVSADEATIYP